MKYNTVICYWMTMTASMNRVIIWEWNILSCIIYKIVRVSWFINAWYTYEIYRFRLSCYWGHPNFSMIDKHQQYPLHLKIDGVTWFIYTWFCLVGSGWAGVKNSKSFFDQINNYTYCISRSSMGDTGNQRLVRAGSLGAGTFTAPRRLDIPRRSAHHSVRHWGNEVFNAVVNTYIFH